MFIDWTVPVSWPVVYIARINVQLVRKLHNCCDDDLTNGESQLIASDAKTALFL